MEAGDWHATYKALCARLEELEALSSVASVPHFACLEARSKRLSARAKLYTVIPAVGVPVWSNAGDVPEDVGSANGVAALTGSTPVRTLAAETEVKTKDFPKFIGEVMWLELDEVGGGWICEQPWDSTAKKWAGEEVLAWKGPAKDKGRAAISMMKAALSFSTVPPRPGSSYIHLGLSHITWLLRRMNRGRGILPPGVELSNNGAGRRALQTELWYAQSVLGKAWFFLLPLSVS